MTHYLHIFIVSKHRWVFLISYSWGRKIVTASDGDTFFSLFLMQNPYIWVVKEMELGIQKYFAACSSKQHLNSTVTKKFWLFFFLFPPVVIHCSFSLFPYPQALSFCLMVWLLHLALLRDNILICGCLDLACCPKKCNT